MALRFDTAPSAILVDARALQDRDYRYRGVGQHSTVILRALRFFDWPQRRPRMIALTDGKLETLAEEHAALFDEVTAHGVDAPGGALFLCLSPMTHDPLRIARYLLDPGVFKVTLFYDLIQLQFPERYLPSLEAQLGFLLNLAWLKTFDAFAAISRFCRGELVSTMKTAEEKVFVSYVAVRQGLEPERGAVPPGREGRRHILFAGGGDPRKNPDCAVIAHAGSERLKRAGIKLVLFGNYVPDARNQLRRLHAERGGRMRDLVFLAHLPDDELRDFYAEAVVTVVASKAEGFSIPIVESNAAGTPVLASDVGAHPELLPDAAHRFDPDDPDELRAKLEAVCFDDAAWEALRSAQAGLWQRFTVETVGDAFLRGLASAFRPLAAPAVRRGARPSLSLLSPLPPAASGVADYSAATFKALAEKAELHVYTSTAGVKHQPWFTTLNAMGQAAFSARRQDATVAVLGNSLFHTGEFDYLLSHGCAAIAHDARMINYYVHSFGWDATVALAQREFGPAADRSQVEDWLHNQERLPILFLSEIAETARPLMVHSPVTADLIGEQYARRPVLLPFAQYNGMDLADATPEVRRALRQEFGWRSREVVICTFGYVSDDKAPDELIWATKFLRDWGVPARLMFCGLPHGHTGERVAKLIAELDLEDYVSLEQRYVSSQRYRKLIFAADVGVQLRTYFMGGLSGALSDCIAAGLPSIANAHLAEAMQAPDFVRRVPDKLSPILIAEAVLDIIASEQNQKRPIEAATACARERSPAAYARTMLAALGLS